MLENWYYIFAMFTFQDSSYFSCQGGGGASQFSGKETLHASTCLNWFCHFHGIICPTHFFLSFFFFFVDQGALQITFSVVRLSAW